MTRTILIAAALILVHALPARAQQRAVIVIVNAANPTASLTADQISRMLLKRDVKWPNGARVVPADLETASATREAFTRRFHDRSIAAVDNYWQQQIFSGRETPPAIRSSETEMIAFVAATPNAIGYVSASTNLPSGVRALQVRAK